MRRQHCRNQLRGGEASGERCWSRSPVPPFKTPRASVNEVCLGLLLVERLLAGPLVRRSGTSEQSFDQELTKPNRYRRSRRWWALRCLGEGWGDSHGRWTSREVRSSTSPNVIKAWEFDAKSAKVSHFSSFLWVMHYQYNFFNLSLKDTFSSFSWIFVPFFMLGR